MLLAGTDDGVYRIAEPTESAGSVPSDSVLERGRTMRVRTFSAVPGAFAATKDGLYHTMDGTTWTDLGVPQTEVYSVVAGPNGDRLYAGTHPSHLYVTESFTPGGESPPWRELTALQNLPSRDDWHTPRHRNVSHVRSLCTHPDRPDRLVVGIEVGGVHLSDDGGETITERRLDAFDSTYSNDVHHVLLTDPDRFIVATGGGLYRTTSGGTEYDRIDDGFEHSYFRESYETDDRLIAGATRNPPGSWGGPRGTDGALFESTDGGDTFEQVAYPGEPTEFVLAFEATENALVAGTNDGSILRRTERGFERSCRLSAPIRSLASI
ncbi:WD40/YVTN/BNR-like repeat-containing protein [Halocatena halophila]|uniref:WD40/YVTN/BNR-like repeat-containing protein n=1 Tax=Halocatena halophila TaxID=2814576 RepID=UPI002ED007F4